MNKIIASNKEFFISMYIVLSLLFTLKVILEIKEEKSVQLQVYSGERLK